MPSTGLGKTAVSGTGRRSRRLRGPVEGADEEDEESTDSEVEEVATGERGKVFGIGEDEEGPSDSPVQNG